jgi:protein SCO1/2
VAALANAVGFGYRYDERTKQYAHAAALMFTSPDGKLVRYLGGVMAEPRDVELALLEASEGKIGTAWDRLFFTCFHYDPEKGTYTPAILNITRVIGAITVILIGFLIIRLIFAERRQGQPVTPARAGLDPLADPGEATAMPTTTLEKALASPNDVTGRDG